MIRKFDADYSDCDDYLNTQCLKREYNEADYSIDDRCGCGCE